jgi:hypothetical protein
MRPTRTTALVFAAVTVAATAAGPSPAAAFFFPIGLVLGGPRAMTVNPSRGPTGSMGRVYTVKPGKASTGTGSRDEDSKSSKASTRTSSKDDDGKPSKASTKTSSKDDDGKSSGSRKGAKSATKAEANANSGHGGGHTQRRWSVEHEPAASKSSGRASTSVQRAGSSAGANSDMEGASLTGTNRNIGDFDENLGEARMDDSVQLPPK